MNAIADLLPAAAGLPLFTTFANCNRCFDIGYWITPTGTVRPCPIIEACAEEHPELSPAGTIVNRAIAKLLSRGAAVDQHLFDVARTLTGYSSASPCSGAELADRHFGHVSGAEGQRRRVSYAINDLHEIWLLPVGTRKDKPFNGYWICVNADDFREFFERASREPISRLTTLHRLAKANWPEYAEQLSIDFFTDMQEDAAQ